MMDFLFSDKFLFVGLIVVVMACGIYIKLKMEEQNSGKTQVKRKPSKAKDESRVSRIEPSKRATRPASEFVGFEDIVDGVVILPRNKYRIVLEVLGTVNFPLLSEAEQDTVEATFSQFLASLSAMKIPIQMYIQTRKLDLLPQISLIDKTQDELPPEIRRYAEHHKQYLTQWMQHAPFVTRRYIVVPFDSDNQVSFEEARRELMRRKEVIESNLRRYLSCKMLTTEELLDLFYVMFNKSKSTIQRSDDFMTEGFTDLFKRGIPTSVIREIAKKT